MFHVGPICTILPSWFSQVCWQWAAPSSNFWIPCRFTAQSPRPIQTYDLTPPFHIRFPVRCTPRLAYMSRPAGHILPSSCQGAPPKEPIWGEGGGLEACSDNTSAWALAVGRRALDQFQSYDSNLCVFLSFSYTKHTNHKIERF